MFILQVAKECAMRVQDLRPASLFSNDDNSAEWLGYITQAAREISTVYPWSMLRKDADFITAGFKAQYDLPEDFLAIVTYNIYNITWNRYIPYSTDDNELTRQAIKNKSQSSIMFRIMDDKIVFTYPIEDGDNLKYTYHSKNFAKYVNPETLVTTYKDYFERDEDQFRLDNELLILRAISLRALNLGFPDADRREQDYQNRLEWLIQKDGGKMKMNIFVPQLINKTTPVEWGVPQL